MNYLFQFLATGVLLMMAPFVTVAWVFSFPGVTTPRNPGLTAIQWVVPIAYVILWICLGVWIMGDF